MDWRIGDINWWGVVDSRKENGWPSWCSAITLIGTTGGAYFLCWECGMKYVVRCIHKTIYWIYGSRSGSCFFHSSLIPQYRVFWYCISFPRQDCLECPCISVQSSGRSIVQGIRSKNENSVSKIWSYLSYQNIVTYYDDYNSKKKPRVTLINRKTPLTKSPSEWSHCRWQKRTKQTRKTRYRVDLMSNWFVEHRRT